MRRRRCMLRRQKKGMAVRITNTLRSRWGWQRLVTRSMAPAVVVSESLVKVAPSRQETCPLRALLWWVRIAELPCARCNISGITWRELKLIVRRRRLWEPTLKGKCKKKCFRENVKDFTWMRREQPRAKDYWKVLVPAFLVRAQPLKSLSRQTWACSRQTKIIAQTKWNNLISWQVASDGYIKKQVRVLINYFYFFARHAKIYPHGVLGFWGFGVLGWG